MVKLQDIKSAHNVNSLCTHKATAKKVLVRSSPITIAIKKNQILGINGTKDIKNLWWELPNNKEKSRQ